MSGIGRCLLLLPRSNCQPHARAVLNNHTIADGLRFRHNVAWAVSRTVAQQSGGWYVGPGRLSP